jgi:hypothetical protein
MKWMVAYTISRIPKNNVGVLLEIISEFPTKGNPN